MHILSLLYLNKDGISLLCYITVFFTLSFEMKKVILISTNENVIQLNFNEWGIIWKQHICMYKLRLAKSWKRRFSLKVRIATVGSFNLFVDIVNLCLHTFLTDLICAWMRSTYRGTGVKNNVRSCSQKYYAHVTILCNDHSTC